MSLTLFVIYSNGQRNDLGKLGASFSKDIQSWMTGFIHFKLSDFNKTQTITFENINVEKFDYINDFYSLYKPLLSFSPDKNKFIDIYSYQLNLAKEGNKLVANPEIDQEIALCNLKTKTWNRILFRGSTNWIEEVAWIGNTKFILEGIEINNNENRIPKIFIGDINSRSLDIFLSNDKNCMQKQARYKAAKLKKLKIQNL